MSLGTNMLRGVIWSGVEKISVQAISLILGIYLARLLTPEEYGTVGLLIVFTSISQVFIDGGFSKALIQKQNRTEIDISTVFYFNLVISITCYLLLWFLAPYIAAFYKIPKLVPLLRVLSLSLIFNGLFSIPSTLLSIKMDFKTLSKVTFTSTIISGIIAIYLAKKGYGEWALVGQTLIKTFLMTLVIWFLVKWQPLRLFSKNSFRNLFGFGSKLLVSSLLNNITNNFASLFIGKVLSTSQLGFYTRGSQFADMPFATMNTALESVLLPGLAPLQNEKTRLISSTQKLIKSTAIIVIPLFVSLAMLSEKLILVLLKSPWLSAAPIMQFICLARLITILSSVNINVLYVIGRSDLVLKQQYIKIIIRIVLLLVALPFGIYYIALAELLSTLIHFFINTYHPGKLMKYGALKQINDFLKPILGGILLALSIFLVSNFIKNELLSIPISLIIGLTAYFGSLMLLKEHELFFLINKIRTYFVGNK